MIGSAEGAYTSGVVWCQAPFGFGISLIVGIQILRYFLLTLEFEIGETSQSCTRGRKFLKVFHSILSDSRGIFCTSDA